MQDSWQYCAIVGNNDCVDCDLVKLIDVLLLLLLLLLLVFEQKSPV